MPSTPRGDVDYERHGGGYARHRASDPRIAAPIHEALGPAETVLNVGAGAGSYEPADRRVIPVEPSHAMRVQRPTHLARAIPAVAENLPFRDASVDAGMAVITIHQWPDARRGVAELVRVTRGAVVVVTFDGDALDPWWLAAYAPELIAAERRRYPAIDTIRRWLGGAARVRPIPVPIDCMDGFAEAFYARPERFLDPAVRRAQSAWTFLAPGVEERIVARLRADLDSGAWDARHGHWRTTPQYEGSLRLIVRPTPPDTRPHDIPSQSTSSVAAGRPPCVRERSERGRSHGAGVGGRGPPRLEPSPTPPTSAVRRPRRGERSGGPRPPTPAPTRPLPDYARAREISASCAAGGVCA